MASAGCGRSKRSMAMSRVPSRAKSPPENASCSGRWTARNSACARRAKIACAGSPNSADDKVMIVIDACQARLGRARIRWYLERGFPVLLTGSKFFTGAPFSGALLVPEPRSSVAPPSTKCPTAWAPIPAATIGRRASRISARRCRRSSISARCCAGARRSPRCATITPCPIPSANSPWRNSRRPCRSSSPPSLASS